MVYPCLKGFKTIITTLYVLIDKLHIFATIKYEKMNIYTILLLIRNKFGLALQKVARIIPGITYIQLQKYFLLLLYRPNIL